MTPGQTQERPLGRLAGAISAAGAAAAVLLYYLYASMILLLLLGFLAVEVVLALVLSHTGLGGVIAFVIAAHLKVLWIVVRSLFLSEEAQFRIVLNPKNAPGLFTVLTRLVGHLKITMPDEVSLEMNAGAWVRLHGFRRGAGKTVLGIGYDLLAGLNESETEGVLAHELVHAKLIQRGFSKSLMLGSARASRMAGMLGEFVEFCRRTHAFTGGAELIYHGAEALAKLAARLVRTCIRQSEFEADRGAAELCGAATIRSALTRLPGIYARAQRLPWRDRVAQLQLGPGFSQWLVTELTGTAQDPKDSASTEYFDPYSTHPRIADRVAALPNDAAEIPVQHRPGIQLLADPDGLAERLLTEIQRSVAAEEEKDSRELQRWMRKLQFSSKLHPLQILGIALVVIGVFFGALTIFAGLSRQMATLAGLTIGVGALLYWGLRYKDQVPLPIPHFAAFKQFWLDRPAIADLEQAQAGQMNALRKDVAGEPGDTAQKRRLINEGYAALAQNDYVRAYAAAVLIFEIDLDCIEGRLCMAIAATALGQTERASLALERVHYATGLGTFSTAWGAAWACLLGGDWARAEALLNAALKARPYEPTLLGLRAWTQARRHKLQSAILNARQASALAPQDVELRKDLIHLLLNGGYLREVQPRLGAAEAGATDDLDLMIARCRLHLMQRDYEKAWDWTQRILRKSYVTSTRLRLAEIHAASRQYERALSLYDQVLAEGFCPEAHLGLGRIELACKNRSTAKDHLLKALNVLCPQLPKCRGPVELFPYIIEELLALEEPGANRHAWLAIFCSHVSLKELGNQSLLVFGIDFSDAQNHLRTILDALEPGRTPELPVTITWTEAPRQLQPIGLARSGVQCVLR
jgi:hypothetical protein